MEKEIKTNLKAAREAITEKQFPKAIKICKDVLKLDKNNYLALVLIGKAYIGQDDAEAVKYFKLALNNAEDPLLALQGLFTAATGDTLVETSASLIKLTPNNYDKMHKKLLENCKILNNLSPTLEFFSNELECTDSDERVQSAANCIADIFQNYKVSIDAKWTGLLEKALRLLTCNITSWGQLLNMLFQILYKDKKFEEILTKSCEILEHSPKEFQPLEWICKVYINTVENSNLDVQNHLTNDITYYVDLLLEVSPGSVNGLMTKGIWLYNQQNFSQAKEFFSNANASDPSSKACLTYLVKTFDKLNAHTFTEFYGRQLSVPNLLLAKALIAQATKEKLQEALSICQKLPETEESINVSTYALISLDELDEAKKNIKEPKSLLMAELLMHNNAWSEAMDILKTLSNPTCYTHLKLGEVHLALADYSSALVEFLNATKLEAFNATCFYWLGAAYNKLGDMVRSKKCLEKCINLYPQHEKAIVTLNAIYKKEDNVDVGIAVLRNAINCLPTGTLLKWAWFHLGFNYCQLRNFNESITAFRHALRLDATCIASWEGLADSYQERGSLNSALKVYEKITELDPKNPYPKLQMANVKTALHLHRDAIVCFNELLHEHPTFWPALKGIAEAHNGLGNFYKKQQLLGRAKDHWSDAVRFLTQAIQIKNDISAMWRILAISLESIATLPAALSSLEVSGSLAGQPSDTVLLDGEKLFELAARCLCRAIKIRNDDVLLWYELALNYYKRSLRNRGDSNMRKSLIDMSIKAVKHSIELLPTRWTNWNLLGILCATKEINNLAMSQHCFVKALELNKKSAITWTNLGVLYLSQSQIKLANKAFGRAQQANTSFVNAWIGQACIAEAIAEMDEAMDLFKHCTSLEYQPESALGFTHWICTALNNETYLQNERFRYAIEHMFGVPLALDSINWYCIDELETCSVEAFCFLGYLFYNQKLYKNAVDAFLKACEKAEFGEIRDKMYSNLGYSYLKVNDPMAAIDAFHKVSEATFQSTIGLALAQFKAKNYEESYSVYESALEYLASNETEKSLILVAMSAMIYIFQGESDAKELLFQCIGLTPPPIEGLFSGCALGIQHGDLQLSSLVLAELEKHETKEKYAHHIAFLRSQFYLKNNDKHTALAYLISQVHIQPANANIRKVLANFILQQCTDSKKLLTSASRIAESTLALELKLLKKSENSSLDAAKALAMASEAMRYVNKSKQKLLAQRAVHINPTCAEARGALISCLS